MTAESPRLTHSDSQPWLLSPSSKPNHGTTAIWTHEQGPTTCMANLLRHLDIPGHLPLVLGYCGCCAKLSKFVRRIAGELRGAGFLIGCGRLLRNQKLNFAMLAATKEVALWLSLKRAIIIFDRIMTRVIFRKSTFNVVYLISTPAVKGRSLSDALLRLGL